MTIGKCEYKTDACKCVEFQHTKVYTKCKCGHDVTYHRFFLNGLDFTPEQYDYSREGIK